MKNYRSRFTMLVIFAVYCLVFLLLVTFSSTVLNIARADTYKWVDDQGNTHYSQMPPEPGVEYSTIAPPPRVDAATLKSRVNEQQQYVDKYQQQRSVSQEEKRLIEEDKLARQQNCKLGHDRLASYQRPGVMLVQADGSRVRATEEQRQEQIKISEDMIKEFCPGN